ncbi:MAG: response regulator [Spirochaetaceae bacterium]|jgi:CheY-like chemotaxis protein|nr:response regulator [Spirochaetaceae bacterium]
MQKQHFTILIVDDEPNNLKLLQQILGDHYILKFANSGEIAFTDAVKHNPDLILLDIMMPGMDGYEVSAKLKSDVLTRNIPIIFLTAVSQPDKVAKGFQAGAVDYVTKPFNSVELMARIKTHLELRKAYVEVDKAKGEIYNLLNQTLTGTIRTLIDFISISNPLLYSLSMRLGKYTKELCQFLKLNYLWEYEIAATLSHIGLLFLPSEQIDKICLGKDLSEAEVEDRKKYISIGGKLLKRIPGTSQISDMIMGFIDFSIEKQFSSSDLKDDNKLEIGKRILRLITDFDNQIAQEKSINSTISYLNGNHNLYDEFLTNALKQSIKVIEAEIVGKNIYVLKLAVGMVLDEDLYNCDEVLLLKKNTEISGSILHKIKPLLESEKIKGSIQVLQNRFK